MTLLFAYFKPGPAGRYLPQARRQGGFYVGFPGFPLSACEGTYEDVDKTRHPGFTRRNFEDLKQIYDHAKPGRRESLRLAVWDRSNNNLEIWQVSGELAPFPREHLFTLYRSGRRSVSGPACKSQAESFSSREWQEDRDRLVNAGQVPPKPSEEQIVQYLSGPNGYRFLPAKKVAGPYRSEDLYTSIDTLSVLQSLNRNTFRLMNEICPTNVSWPADIFGSGSNDRGQRETPYGRFVREYLDGLMHPGKLTAIRELDESQRIELVGATLNPILMETAAALFAIDLGMTLDSANGKGRHGIDVVACCNERTPPFSILRKLESMNLSISDATRESLQRTGTIAFQCKAYHEDIPASAKAEEAERSDESSVAERLLYFRYVDQSDSNQNRNVIAIQRVLRAVADRPCEFPHLYDWLNRMCSVVVGKP